MKQCYNFNRKKTSLNIQWRNTWTKKKVQVKLLILFNSFYSNFNMSNTLYFNLWSAENTFRVISQKPIPFFFLSNFYNLHSYKTKISQITNSNLPQDTLNIPRKWARPSRPTGSQKAPTLTFIEAAHWSKNNKTYQTHKITSLN